jgi:deoxyribonuclease IV
MEFGAHVSAAGGIDSAIDRAEALGCDCVQIFTQSPRMWKPTVHKPEAIERFRARRE